LCNAFTTGGGVWSVGRSFGIVSACAEIGCTWDRREDIDARFDRQETARALALRSGALRRELDTGNRKNSALQGYPEKVDGPLLWELTD
jgi:hypothetical protein